MTPNTEQLVSILRQIMLAAGGGLVTKGYVDDATLQTVVGAVAILIASGWAIYTRRGAGLVAAAAAQPGVRTVVADPALADAVPSRKVVPPGAG